MWKEAIETLWQMLHLAEETRQNTQEIKALEKRLFDLAALMDRRIHELVVANEQLSHEVQRMADELKRQWEHEESERRILRLELENYLLRQERGLPPAKPQLPPESETDDQ
jgi:hypothetical protein